MRPDIDAGPIDRKCSASKGPVTAGVTGGRLFGASGQERLRGDGEHSNGEGDQA